MVPGDPNQLSIRCSELVGSRKIKKSLLRSDPGPILMREKF